MIFNDPEPHSYNQTYCEDVVSGRYTYNKTYVPRNKICVPKEQLDEEDEEYNESASNLVDSFISKFYFVVIAFLLAAIGCYIYFGFMCCCASGCIWACIIGAVGIFFILGLVFIILAVSCDDDMTVVLIVLAVIFLIIGLVAMLVVCCCKDRIKLAIAVIAEAANAIAAMPCLPFLSGFAAVISAVTSIIILLGMVLYISSFDLAVKPEGTVPDISGGGVFLLVVMFFVYFWVQMFITGINQTTIGGAVSTWYFMANKDELPFFNIGHALGRAFRYHSGAIAFGSGVIALVKTIVLLCEIARSDLKSSEGGLITQIILLLISCLQCIVERVQKYLEFLAARTYVLISIKGGTFYATAKQTLYLLLRNLLRSVVLESVIDFVFFIAQAVIIAAASFFLILMVRPDIFGASSSNYPEAWPLLILLGIVFIVFAVFIMFDSFYYTVVTVFIDFLVDEEMAQSHPDYQFAASPELGKHMNDVARKGYSMAKSYKESHSDFDLAYYAEPPPQYTVPANRSTSSQQAAPASSAPPPTSYAAQPAPPPQKTQPAYAQPYVAPSMNQQSSSSYVPPQQPYSLPAYPSAPTETYYTGQPPPSYPSDQGGSYPAQ